MLKYFLLLWTCIFTLFHLIKAQPSTKFNYLSEIKSGNVENTLTSSNNSNSLMFDDLTIEMRISELNFQTPINLDYNENVNKYIRYLVNERKEVITQSLSNSSYYFPIFETYLDKYHLPMELKYLSVIESGLNPFARSKSGAVGLWQFLLPTAQLLNLKINSFVDERQDPIKSTEAACNYLEYLYNMFNDWQLAIAAYNGGPGNVKNAMLRSGKNTFWEIKPYLSKETQNYVPAFIAMVYLMNYASDYQIQPGDKNFYYHQIDTVLISKPIYFSTLSQKLNIPLDVIRFLNPAYKQDYIPKMQSAVALVLPSEKIPTFIQLQNEILSNEFPNQEQLNARNLKKATSYTVKKGDYLTKLAIDFRCSPDDIKKWNNLKSNDLTTGSTLILWTPSDIQNTIIQ
ncbi:MAG TPA: transglycosylase SLT domain-containing protein [Bacteroidales bacterium]|nr:transglycosylase SLT domain-containing protein [Bacteroidales bacterium]HNV96467.1 transglycosylase SLT domain-containing protein [Bacteroidales bacterium]